MSATPTTSTIPSPLSMGQVLRDNTLRRLWYAQIVSVLGDFLALFAVISVLTFKLNATPQQVNGLQICYILPLAVLSILAGVFVDRWNIKATLVGSDLTRAALVLLLLGANRLWHFYAILAGISMVSSFFGPAQGIAIRSIVPIHGLRAANSLMQQVMFGMRIIGPAIAAFIVARLGARVCYTADSISFLASGLLVASLAIKRFAPATTGAPEPEPAKPAHPFANIWPDMKQGVNFILHHAALLYVMLAFAAGMFILGGFGPLIAVYVRDSVHASTQFFGISSALIGIGMMLGGLIINTRFKHLANATLVTIGMGGIAVALCLLAGLALMSSTLVANFIIGASVAAIIVPSSAMIQQETPAALMGRVGSAVMSLVFSAQIAGLALSGVLANIIGVRHVFAVCAVLLVVFIILGKLFMEPKPTPTPTSTPAQAPA